MTQRTRYQNPQWNVLMLTLCLFMSWLAGSSPVQADEEGVKGRMPYNPHERSEIKGPSPHGADGRFTVPLEQQLNLSGQQAAEFRKIETAYKVMTITKTADIRVGEVELAALLEQEPLDVEAVKQKVKDIGGVKTALMMARVESLLKLKKILKPEQDEQFRKLLRNRMELLTNHSPHHGMTIEH